jgi:E3 ubiquitin-protein ligase HUWE1
LSFSISGFETEDRDRENGGDDEDDEDDEDEEGDEDEEDMGDENQPEPSDGSGYSSH